MGSMSFIVVGNALINKAKGSSTDGLIYTIVEENPQFPDGQAAMFRWLGSNIKYPKDARENGVQGTVYVGFVVEKDGSVSNVKVAKGIGGGCDEEAIRVVSSLPNFKPGIQNGAPVRVQYKVAVPFIMD